MKEKTFGKWIADFGGTFWNVGSTVALILLFDWHPTWNFVAWSAVIGFGLIVVGAIVDGTREYLREVREARISIEDE